MKKLKEVLIIINKPNNIMIRKTNNLINFLKFYMNKKIKLFNLLPKLKDFNIYQQEKMNNIKVKFKNYKLNYNI